ncbi:hypothetical protein RAS1_03450 [Phycisphaerae bacterium RAS1]|nr:hypothetical protein RAS1_03450 [Phycisphaerae bacterium RAS1]
MTSTTLPAQETPAARQAAARAANERRRRVWRNVAFFFVTLFLILLLSLYNRDEQEVQADRRRMEFWRESFQKLLDAAQELPLQLPTPPGDSAALRDDYIYNMMYQQVLRVRGKAALCYRTQAAQLALRRDGRHVLIFNGRALEIVWMNEDEFAEQAEVLGMYFHGK